MILINLYPAPKSEYLSAQKFDAAGEKLPRTIMYRYQVNGDADEIETLNDALSVPDKKGNKYPLKDDAEFGKLFLTPNYVGRQAIVTITDAGQVVIKNPKVEQTKAVCKQLKVSTLDMIAAVADANDHGNFAVAIDAVAADETKVDETTSNIGN